MVLEKLGPAKWQFTDEASNAHFFLLVNDSPVSSGQGLFSLSILPQWLVEW